MGWRNTPRAPIFAEKKGWGVSPALPTVANPRLGWKPLTQILVEPPSAVSNFVGLAPSMYVTVSIDIPPPATGSFVGLDPSIYVAFAETVSNTQQFDLVGLDPTINLSQNLDVPEAQFDLIGLEPMLWHDQNIIVPEAQFNLIGLDPNVYVNYLIDAPYADSTFVGLDPVVSQNQIIVPDQGIITAVGLDPMVWLANPITDTNGPNAPQTIVFTPGALYNTFDLVGIGGGGGGEGSAPTPTGNRGGGAGKWNSIRIVRGSTLSSSNPNITVVIGDGGNGMGIYYTPGDNGQVTTFQWYNQAGVLQTLTCNFGGGGGRTGENTDSAGNGANAGNHTFQGVTYIGGVAASGRGSDPPGQPGSGGGAAAYATVLVGKGGAGQAWIRSIP